MLMAKKILLAFLCVFMAAGSAMAAELNGVTLPDHVLVEGKPLLLNGMGQRRVLFFDVYVAGLYLEQKSSDAEAILARDECWRLVMSFQRDVEAAKIREGFIEGMVDNTPERTMAVEEGFARMNAMMSDVQDGQSVVFTHAPGKGVEVVVSGKARGIVPGLEFSRALMRVWLGPNPGPGEKFKKGLLGG